MAELFHECGIAAVYHLRNRETSRLAPSQGASETSRLMPRLLLDIQNRGQLAAGMTAFCPDRKQLIDTHRDVGTVTEVFHLSHPKPAERLMKKYAGPAAIGHVRYATCGQDDRSYAQPFERHHIQKSKWFSFAFNGQLANYPQLRKEMLSNRSGCGRGDDLAIVNQLGALEVRPSLHLTQYGYVARPVEFQRVADLCRVDAEAEQWTVGNKAAAGREGL